MSSNEGPKTTILARIDLKSSEIGSFDPGEVAWFSMPSPDKATPNEDGLLICEIDEQRLVLAVADGLGGRPGGAEAAEASIAALADAIALAKDEEALQPRIIKGFERANEAILALGTGAASTLIAMEVDGAGARTYHVGDSLALIVGQRGRKKFETVAHSPVGYAVEAGMLSQREAMHHRSRHLVSNIVGSAEMRIEVGPVTRLASRDTALLASDGLFDNLHMEEIIKMIRSGPLEEVAGRLVEAAQRRMVNKTSQQPSKPDDLSFMVFRPRKKRSLFARPARSDAAVRSAAEGLIR